MPMHQTPFSNDRNALISAISMLPLIVMIFDSFGFAFSPNLSTSFPLCWISNVTPSFFRVFARSLASPSLLMAFFVPDILTGSDMIFTTVSYTHLRAHET